MASPTTSAKPGPKSPPAPPGPKPVTRSEAKPEAKLVDKPVSQPQQTVDWDALPAANDGSVGGAVRIDVKTEIPKSIQDEVEDSLAKNLALMKKVADGDTSVPTRKDKDGKLHALPHKKTKILPSAELAIEYTRLIKRYGQYRPEDENGIGQLTVRGGPVASKPNTVVFHAKPFEERGPISKKASKDDSTVTKK